MSRQQLLALDGDLSPDFGLLGLRYVGIRIMCFVGRWRLLIPIAGCFPAKSADVRDFADLRGWLELPGNSTTSRYRRLDDVSGDRGARQHQVTDTRIRLGYGSYRTDSLNHVYSGCSGRCTRMRAPIASSPPPEIAFETRSLRGVRIVSVGMHESPRSERVCFDWRPSLTGSPTGVSIGSLCVCGRPHRVGVYRPLTGAGRIFKSEDEPSKLRYGYETRLSRRTTQSC